MKKLTGKVKSAKMNKTIIVEIEIQMIHPLYKKILKRYKRYKVHCEDTSVKEGDLVSIVPARPISRDKHFKLLEKISK